MAPDPLGTLPMVCDQLRRVYLEQRVAGQGRNKYELELMIERLWCYAGEAARRYVATAQSMQTSDFGEWKLLIGFRDKLSHLLPEEVESDLIWNAEQDLHQWVIPLVEGARGSAGGQGET